MIGRSRGAMLRLAGPLILALAVSYVTASPALAQSICNAGDQVVLSPIEITESCTITGSLTIHGGGLLRADFNANPTAVLRVEGNVSVGGSGVLWIDRGTLEIQQDYNRHRDMWTTDDATVILHETTVVLNQGVGLKYMVYNAFDRSKLFVVGATLDRTSSWLISNHYGYSGLTAIGTVHVPTEIYVKEGSTVRIAEPTSNTGVWMDFENGAAGVVDLPEQVGSNGELQPYSWRFGRGSAGVSGVGWQLEIANASIGLGLESHGGSHLTVNGQGVPASGELKISYHVDAGVQTLSGLAVGLQNTTLGGDQLTLNRVQLGPISWQIYAHENEMLSIYSSIVNEVGVSAGGHITVYDSIIQFGGVTSLGSSAASIAVHNSQIHSQTIQTLRDGIINLYDSAVFGAAVVAHEATSAIHFHRGAMLQNLSDACPLVLADMVDEWGVPKCNPFLAPGAEVTRAGSGPVSCDATYGCTW